MQDTEERKRRGTTAQVAGVRLGRVFLPWQTIAVLTLAVAGLVGISVSGRDDRPLRIDTASQGADSPSEDGLAAEPESDDSTTLTTIYTDYVEDEAPSHEPGPFKLPPGRDRLTLQAKLDRLSDGLGCSSTNTPAPAVWRPSRGRSC